MYVDLVNVFEKLNLYMFPKCSHFIEDVSKFVIENPYIGQKKGYGPLDHTTWAITNNAVSADEPWSK